MFVHRVIEFHKTGFWRRDTCTAETQRAKKEKAQRLEIQANFPEDAAARVLPKQKETCTNLTLRRKEKKLFCENQRAGDREPCSIKTGAVIIMHRY